MAKYSNDAQYVSAFNKSLVAANRAKLLLADLNKAEAGTDKAISLKTKYDTAMAEYNKYEAMRVARKNQIDSAEKKEKETKAQAKNKKIASADIRQLEYEAQVAKNTGNANALADAEAKLKIARDTAAGINPSQTSTSGTGTNVDENETANNKFKNYTVNSNGMVTNKDGAQTYFIGAKGTDGSSTMQEYTSIVQARNAFLKNYSAPGALDKLKQDLFNKDYINSSQLKDPGYSWVSGVDKMITMYTYNAVAAVQIGGAKEAPLIDTWFASAAGGGSGGQGGTRKDTSLNLTTVGDAHTEINDYMVDALGREATQEEKDAYFKDINNRERKSAVQTVEVKDDSGNVTKTTRSGAYVTDDERLAALNSVVIKALSGTDAGELLKSAKGSQVAVQIAALQKAGAEYGQPLSPGEALKYVIAGGTEKDALKKQTERLRLNSMTMYGNLKDHIRDGGNVKDIADQYALIKSKKLGIPVTDSSTDKDVQAALTREGGLMSTSEFNRIMQGKPEWRQTPEARDVASNFADTILKSFGFMG
jgi:hypothetical protein